MCSALELQHPAEALPARQAGEVMREIATHRDHALSRKVRFGREGVDNGLMPAPVVLQRLDDDFVPLEQVYGFPVDGTTDATPSGLGC